MSNSQSSKSHFNQSKTYKSHARLEIYQRYLSYKKKIDRSRVNELTHLFNFKRSVLCNQISPKHVHDTSASRSIFFAINAQIVLKFSPYLARGSPIISHTKILPIGSKYFQKADIRSPKQNYTPDRRPFHLEATYTARNATDLLQVVHFIGLLQVVNKLQQVC